MTDVYAEACSAAVDAYQFAENAYWLAVAAFVAMAVVAARLVR